VLRAPAGELVTLGDEIELIESYLAVERARFEERLRVEIDVPPALLKVRLPALLLQPLVENAIKHGISPSRRGGALRIVARTEAPQAGGAESLRLEVRDTGVGVDRLPAPGGGGSTGGLGLLNVRRRLSGIYGERASLDFASQPGQGTTVTLRLPISSEVNPG
ncbi:MAG: sensor histidine kinase, partial [Acidobacteriota bacterium]